MSLEIGRLTFQAPVPPPSAPGGPRSVVAARAADRADISVPAVPPAEVLEELDRAAQRAEELHAQRRQLHFSTEKRRGRIIVEVRDLEGRVIRTISPSRALDVMAGAEVD